MVYYHPGRYLYCHMGCCHMGFFPNVSQELNQQNKTIMRKDLFIAFFTMACISFSACSDNENKESDIHNPSPKEQWGPTAKGSDFTVPQLY